MTRDDNGQLVSGTMLVGRYRIEQFLAGGGMGLVYIAHDQRLADRPCAVKEIFDRFTDPEERRRAIEYFHREADTLSQLNHPAIPAIFDRFGEGNCHYLVMDYVRGVNLEDELKNQEGPLPESQVVDIARQLCDVLTYLHSFHPPIVYRDMKSGNVILTSEGRVVLIDFGIARIFTPQGKATLIGTPGFAPPEQYTGKVDERSDIYGLAATLHYILTGRDPEKHPPFSFPPVHSLRPEASSFLAQAIDCALSYNVEKRPSRAAEFKEMILYGSGLTATGTSANASKTPTQALHPLPADTGSLAPPKRHRGRRLVMLLALLFVSVMGYSLYAYFEATDRPSLQQLSQASVSRLWQLGEQVPWERITALLPEQAQVKMDQFVENLPWKKEERLKALRADPLELVSLKILNTTRDGTSLSEEKDRYTAKEIKYLTWEASFKNRLAGLEGAHYQLEGRFFDPEGGLAGKSQARRFVQPEKTEVRFQGITLIEGLKERAKGTYQLELYLQDQKLVSHELHIEEAKKVVKKEVNPRSKPAPVPPSSVPSEEKKRREEETRRLALIRKRSKKPLELLTISFLNSTKEGKPLSTVAEAFPASQVRFVAWEAVFRNQLHNLLPSYHRVEATYYSPNGQILGTVQDGKEVPVTAAKITFTARLGNSNGGAFAPGSYRVDFYVDGRPFASRKFSVEDDRDLALMLRRHQGSLRGLVFGREVALEIDFRPQQDGALRGDLIVHEAGYGVVPLKGRVQGTKVEFQSLFGHETYHFRGAREGDRLSGTFTAYPSETSGNWSVRLGGSS